MSFGTSVRRYYRGHRLVTMRSDTAGETRHYHFDHQGTTQCLTDNTGAVTDRFAANAWGVQVKRTGSSVNRHWYIGATGYYRQESRSPVYVRARWMVVSLGAWLSADPVRTRMLYRYVENQATLTTDSTGLQSDNIYRCWDCCKAHVRVFFRGDHLVVAATAVNDARNVAICKQLNVPLNLRFRTEAWSGLPGAEKGIESREQEPKKRNERWANYGPIPRGCYYIDSWDYHGSINFPCWKFPFIGLHDWETPSWGKARGKLKPRPETQLWGRKPDTFYLHGGDFKGSHGCIDVGHCDINLFQILEMDENHTIPVWVDYSGWSGKVPPPLPVPVDPKFWIRWPACSSIPRICSCGIIDPSLLPW